MTSGAEPWGKNLKNGIFQFSHAVKSTKLKNQNPFPTFFRHHPRDAAYHFLGDLCHFLAQNIKNVLLFLGQIEFFTFNIGVSAERERCYYVPDHNLWTVTQKLKYDSSLERGMVVLKHTKKANWNTKKAIHPPYLNYCNYIV